VVSSSDFAVVTDGQTDRRLVDNCDARNSRQI